MTALAAHSWEGNVRELQNVLANLTVSGPRYGRVGPDALRSAQRKYAAGEPGVTRQGLSKLMTRLQVDRFDPGRERSSHAPSRQSAPAGRGRRTQNLRRLHPS